MSELDLLQMIAGKVPYAASILMGLGALLVVGQVVVLLTPSKKDDEAWEKLHAIPYLGGFLKALTSFAPIQKK